MISDANGATGLNPGNLNYNGSGTLTLSAANTYTGITHAMSGTIALAAAGALPAGTNLTIDTGALVVADNLGSTVPLVVTNLSVSGKLDLNNNAMIVHNTSIGAVTSLVKAGFNAGGWNGPSGIISTMASSDTTHLTALGVIQNSVDGTPTGTVLHSTFEGQPSTDTDVLVKYTYYGDTNLDGMVDGTDYSRIDAAYLADAGSPGPLSGWFNGDFNYDGVINGSDYALIDNAYNAQRGIIASQIASPTAQVAGAAGSFAVPEPASLALLTTGLLGVLRRRRRR